MLYHISLNIIYHISLKSNILTTFLILLGLWSARCTYLTNHPSKHSLSSIIWILIKLIFGLSDSFGNLKYLLPGKGLLFQILIVWLTTELITQPEPFRIYFFYVWYNRIKSILWIDHHIAFINNCFCFWIRIKVAIFCCIITF